MSRNIGCSILPSNCSAILMPIETKIGTLQVRVIESEDTHGLFCSDVLIAKHPNGYSCHALAERIRDGDRAAEQAVYIVACGGMVTPEGCSMMLRVKGK